MKNIAIFASGNGTNAENIIKYFSNKLSAKIPILITNNPKAQVIKRAEKLNIPVKIFSKEMLDSYKLVSLLSDYKVDFIVLAGYLLKISDILINEYPNRIINLHPALLPKYGGKGMYGLNVHRAVIDAHEKESGITIHRVNSKYDDGDIIFQAKCEVLDNDTPETLANRIHSLEYDYYPSIIEKEINAIDK